AVDCAGNQANQNSGTFTFDDIPPEVSITSPTSGSYINGTQTITRSLTETNQQTDEARLRWPSGGTNYGNWTTYTPGTTQISALDGWNSIGDGQTFDIEIRHTDCAGNISTTSSVTNLTKDVTPPTINSFVMSCDNSSGTITFSEPVYANYNATGNLTTTNLSVTKSGGNANINTASISHTAGATTATANITWTGTLNGFELVKVETQGPNKVFDAAGNAMVHPNNATDYSNVTITIVSNPTAQTVCQNTNASFTGSATGGAGLQYRWQRSTDGGSTFTDLTDSVQVSGSTGTTLTLTTVPSSWNNYQFRLKAYNECDTKYSTAATLTVTLPTAITTQPTSSQTICAGGTAGLSVTAQGGGLSYQWQYYNGSNWVNVSDGTPTGADYTPDNGQSATLQISGLSAGSYQYRVIVYGTCAPTTVTSNTATVNVNAQPTATISGTTTICSGSNATLTLTLTGTAPWSVDVANYGTITNITSSPYSFNVSPTTTTTYTINSVSDGNSCSGTGSGSATVTLQGPPTANAGADQNICQGSDATLSGTATNYSTVTWTTSGDGTFANANSLNTTYTPGTNDITNGSVTLTLTANAITPCSTPATDQMTVHIEGTPVAPTITKNPNTSTVCEGTDVSATFSGGSGGNGTETYEYEYDNSGTWNAYTAGNPISTTGHTSVTVRARRNGTNCTSSGWTTASWSIEATPVAPTITKNPNTTTVCQGVAVSATFTGGSGGNGTNTYEYRTNDGNGWSSWAAYTPGTNIATTGLVGVEIRAVRGATVCSPAINVASWTVTTSTLSLTCSSNSPVCSGSTLNLSVTVTGGSGNYSYSWTGPNGFSSSVQNPTRANMTSADAGTYSVTVTDNITGCVSSCNTSVSVNSLPSITGQPSDYKLVYGNSASPAFNPTTSGATSFQWYYDNDNSGYDGTAISGATNEDYNVSSATFTDDRYYYLTATNSCGSVNSNYVRLKVAPTQASSITPGTRTKVSIAFSWTRGNGDGVIVTAKQGTSNTDTPTDGTTYSANSDFSSAPSMGTSTAKVVYNGTGSSVTVTGLAQNTSYTFVIFEYKSATAGIVYNTNITANQNRRTISTLSREIVEESVVGSTFAITSVQPNPVEGNAFALQLYSDIGGTSQVEILNTFGEKVYSGAYNIEPGITLIPLTMPTENGGTPAGTYFLRVTLLGETLVYKFIYLP
ncbi:MAG: hypothetical protein ACP5I9_10040, partial [Candidatus Kapaibacteriota bacterium]